ncbi:hypothetical protein, partial [Actinomadura nitritigenes]
MSVRPDAPRQGTAEPSPRPPGSQREWRDAALALVAALDQRGLVASPYGHGAVRATNPDGEPDPDNPLGQLMHPGMRQEVRCRPYGPAGELWWHWVWSGPTRDAEPELEPLCPLWEADVAADRIHRVLALI